MSSISMRYCPSDPYIAGVLQEALPQDCLTIAANFLVTAVQRQRQLQSSAAHGCVQYQEGAGKWFSVNRVES
jgi:hypothetical protein